MGRRQDGFRDRAVDDHLLAMQGLGDLNGLLGENHSQWPMALKGSVTLLATSCKGTTNHQNRVVLVEEQEISKDGGTEKYEVRGA